ncbi:alpha/beta fold hydrolase [Arthrobacter sp. ov407]|uniref:alpha/beta fold hydrolase n=1 Tax=Arthrobacter sp. ov407 TaxID=1761748 RepID=UPI003524E07A
MASASALRPVGARPARVRGRCPRASFAPRHNEDGTTSIQPGRARDVLYADCTEADSDWATGLLVPQQPGHGRGVPSRVAWQSVESTYLRCEQDKALSPELQERMARRCSNTVNLESSHSPFISQPGQLAEQISKI